MKLRFKNLFMISFLAVAGLFGVTSAVLAKQAEETPVVEKAEAEGSHTIYYATTTSRNNYYARCQYGNNWYGSHTFSLAGRSGNKYIYTASVYEKYDGLDNLWIKYGNDPTGDTGGTLVVHAIDGYKSVSTYENKVYDGGWKDIYTVTYNPNGASGSTKTDYKINGTSYTILSYSSAGITAHSYKHAVKWSTNETGTGTDYQPSATYSTNANLNLFFIEDWYTYQFKVNSGGWNTLEKTGDTPEGYVAKFSALYSFTSGDTVTFRKYYGSETPSSITPSSFENNIVSPGTIYYSADTYIDLKLTSGNGHTIDVGGFSAVGVVVVRGGTNYKCYCITDTYDPSHATQNQQFHANNIMLLPGDTLKATFNAGDPYTISVENHEKSEGGIYGISEDGVVSTPGYYTVYVKSNDWGWNFNKVYLSMEDSATADLIADTFVEALTTVCTSTVSGGATSQITTAFGTQKNYYDHLTSDCQDLVEAGTTTKLNAMHAQYDYIVKKYGKTIAPDYLGRNPSAKASINNISPFKLFSEDEDSLPTLIIIVASSISLLSITALSVLVIKKRKRQVD